MYVSYTAVSFSFYGKPEGSFGIVVSMLFVLVMVWIIVTLVIVSYVYFLGFGLKPKVYV